MLLHVQFLHRKIRRISFEEGRIPAKFITIDDGWQSVGMDPNGIAWKADCAANFANRLTHIKENQFNHNLDLWNILSPCEFTGMCMCFILHPMAEYHAAARAVGGCPIYVSDKPGHHDFNLLKKLVLPDGSILRARLLGRPTKDCLFADPARDGRSLLKIWNMNDFFGVVGVFNCQGAGWCKVGKKNHIHDESPGTVTVIIRAKDIDYFQVYKQHSLCLIKKIYIILLHLRFRQCLA